MFMPSNREVALFQNYAIHIASAYHFKEKRREPYYTEGNIFTSKHYLAGEKSFF